MLNVLCQAAFTASVTMHRLVVKSLQLRLWGPTHTYKLASLARAAHESLLRMQGVHAWLGARVLAGSWAG